MDNFPRGSAGGPRRSRNVRRGSSSQNIRINGNLLDRMKANKVARLNKKAIYLSTLPKGRFQRILFRMHPRRLAQYWFSREGGIMALKIAGIGIIVGFFLVIGIFAYFRKDLPKINDLSGQNLGGSITYYDRTGQTVLWQDYDAVKRIPVSNDNMSPYIKQATVAIEDKDFYNHGAFDVRGIIRAGFHDAFGGGGSVQGGSTITQQLVKLNEKWTNERTITRKFKELILAVELEREYTKQDILTGYLNVAPYGGVEYGVETAARDYFNTTAKDLTLSQAAMLAAIPKSPTFYSPYSSTKYNTAMTSDLFNEQALLSRQHYILDQMAEQGMITQDQADAAKKVDVLSQVQPLKSKYNGIKAPYFVLAAKQQLEKKYGSQTVQRGGWKVTTTLNLDLQNLAEQQVQKNLHVIKSHRGDNAAFAAEDVQTGQMVALVGGVDFGNTTYGELNYAKTPISPGSSFKPYDYVTLLSDKDLNAGAGSVLYDSQQALPGWACTDKKQPKQGGNCLWDYDFKYPGALTVRYALAGSRNVPAVKAMLTETTDKVINTAEMMMNGGSDGGYGYKCFSDTALTKKTQCYGSSAIGDGAFLHLDEHVNGLATLSRLGKFIPETYILEIKDSANRTIDKWTQPSGKQVISEDGSYIIDNILSDPNATYLKPSRRFHVQSNGWHFAIKTGTTNDNYDALMTSWSTKYAAAVWVGEHTRNVALTGAMEDLTGPILSGWMINAHKDLKPVSWTQPSDIKTAPAYVVRGTFGFGTKFPSPSTDIYPSWYTPKAGGGGSSQTIDKVSGFIATSCTPALARQTVGNSNDNAFSIDKFVNGGIKAQSQSSQTDNIHDCGDTKPAITATGPASGICSDTDNGGKGCAITVTVSQGTHPLGGSGFGGTVTLNVNGSDVSTENVESSPTSLTFYYQPTTAGSLTFTATVTDSVLYQNQASAAATAVVSSGPANPNPGNPGNGNGH